MLGRIRVGLRHDDGRNALHIGGEARTLARIALADYFAGALLMPHGAFHKATKSLRNDVELLQHRFGVSFEQACHRLTNLQRPGQRGAPLHFLRSDIAGNLSVFLAAGAVWLTGAAWPDLVVASGLLVLLLRSSVRVITSARAELRTATD